MIAASCLTARQLTLCNSVSKRDVCETTDVCASLVLERGQRDDGREFAALRRRVLCDCEKDLSDCVNWITNERSVA